MKYKIGGTGNDHSGTAFSVLACSSSDSSAGFFSGYSVTVAGASVKDLPELITEFDESLWAGLVDSMTVHSKDRIVFRLTCGMVIKV